MWKIAPLANGYSSEIIGCKNHGLTSSMNGAMAYTAVSKGNPFSRGLVLVAARLLAFPADHKMEVVLALEAFELFGGESFGHD